MTLSNLQLRPSPAMWAVVEAPEPEPARDSLTTDDGSILTTDDGTELTT